LQSVKFTLDHIRLVGNLWRQKRG